MLKMPYNAGIPDVDDDDSLNKRDGFETGEALSVASVAATDCDNGDTSEIVCYTSSSTVDTNMAQYIGQGSLDLLLSTVNRYRGGTTPIVY